MGNSVAVRACIFTKGHISLLTVISLLPLYLWVYLCLYGHVSAYGELPAPLPLLLCIWACFSTYWGLLPPPSLPLLWVTLCMWACLSSNHDLPQSILYLWACLSTNHDLPQSILYLWACLCLCGHVSLLTMTSPNPSFTCGHVSVYVGMSLY